MGPLFRSDISSEKIQFLSERRFAAPDGIGGQEQGKGPRKKWPAAVSRQPVKNASI
jgi:hypothetical protein